ncbi:alpha/beta hydrolase family protein [Streptomyces sp. NPDC002073]
MSTTTYPERAEALVDALAAQPRPKAVAAFADGVLVLRADVPNGLGATVPTLIGYRRDAADGWQATWSAPRAIEAVAVPGGFLYVLQGGHQALAFRSADGGPERVLRQIAGEVAAMAVRPGSGTVLCTVRTEASPGSHPEGLLRGSDAVWATGPGAGLGTVRRPEGDWRIMFVSGDGADPDDGRELPVTVPAGAVLTGEAAWSGPDTLLLGVAHHRPDGTRRFGLLEVSADDGGALRELLFDGIDLCYPVPDPDRGQVAYLGTSVPSADAPPVQSACVVRADSAELTVLDAPAGTWQRPVGWDGPGRLVCTAEDGPRRRLYVHEDGVWSDVPVTGSVASVRVAGGRAAVLGSALDAPPVLDVVALRSGTAERVESSDRPELPGTLSYHPQEVPGASGPLAAWLCRPARGPVRGLVVFFHGGPFQSWTQWSWRWNPWPFVACGYAVALIEPPMSLGYVPAVAGGWRNWRAGIAAVATRQVELLRAEAGLQDVPLALMGGSFGGYLSLNTAERLRPRLVVAHAAPLDLAQVAETSDVGWQWLREYGDPTGDRERYRANSLPGRPVPDGTRVLLSHGMHDGLVPPTETLRAHRSLSRQGIRSEVAFFRTEAHPLSRPRNIRAWYRWVLTACEDELAGGAVDGSPQERPGEAAQHTAGPATGEAGLRVPA